MRVHLGGLFFCVIKASLQKLNVSVWQLSFYLYVDEKYSCNLYWKYLP